MKKVDEYTFGSDSNSLKFVKLEDFNDLEKDFKMKLKKLLDKTNEVIAQNERLKGAIDVALPHVRTCYTQGWANREDLEIVKDALIEKPIDALISVRSEAFENGYLDGWNDFAVGAWKCTLRSEAFLDIFREKMK